MSLRSFLCCLALAIACNAHAYPDKPLRFVVPFQPGGVPDATARALSKQLQLSLKQSIIIDNRGGADGMIGTDKVVRATPDGYTFLFTSQTLLTKAISDNKKIELEPVTHVDTSNGYMIVVHTSVPVLNIKSLIELSKAKELRYGSSQNLIGELFNVHSSARLVFIPYRSLGQSITALLGGDELQVGFLPMSLVHSEKLRPIAVTASMRWRSHPDIPTVAETIPGFVYTGGWHGLFAPLNTPHSIILLMYAAVHNVLATPEMREYLQAAGYLPVGSSPAEFSEFLRNDAKRWAEIIRIVK